jgi:hypothetical protein
MSTSSDRSGWQSRRPNFMLYTRPDGTSFIVGKAVGAFIIIGHGEHWATRREAVAAGLAGAGQEPVCSTCGERHADLSRGDPAGDPGCDWDNFVPANPAEWFGRGS